MPLFRIRIFLGRILSCDFSMNKTRDWGLNIFLSNLKPFLDKYRFYHILHGSWSGRYFGCPWSGSPAYRVVRDPAPTKHVWPWNRDGRPARTFEPRQLNYRVLYVFNSKSPLFRGHKGYWKVNRIYCVCLSKSLGEHHRFFTIFSYYFILLREKQVYKNNCFVRLRYKNI